MLVCFTILQHHRGHPPRSPVWVFGMVDVSHQPALGYLEIVPQRDAATLLPIIQTHSNPGTKIWSDEWRAYQQVQTLPNITTHKTVNLTLHFKDPVTGVHTNHIESYWNRVKVKLKRMRGCHRHQLPSYLESGMAKLLNRHFLQYAETLHYSIHCKLAITFNFAVTYFS